MNKEDLKLGAMIITGILIVLSMASWVGDRGRIVDGEARMLCIEEGGVWVDGTCAWNKPPPPWTIPVLEGGGF